MSRTRHLLAVPAIFALAAGCNAILGIDDHGVGVDRDASTTSAPLREAGAGTPAPTADDASSFTDDATTAMPVCAPDSGSVPCSETPDGSLITWPVGTPMGYCSYGTKSCGNDGFYSACAGALPPARVNCASGLDHSCTGVEDKDTCTGCPAGDGGATTSGSSGSCFDFALPAQQGIGICVAGTRTCELADGGASTFWGACAGEVGPKARDCTSSLDNDCDGTPDNAECGVCTTGMTASCYDGASGTQNVGSCHAGTKTCVLQQGQTTWGPCSGEVLPQSRDTCDQGNDANCDGHDKSGCTCYNGATATCASVLGAKGTCAGGTSTCSGGSWGACSIAPASEDSCAQGNDDNCNGTANEECSCIEGVTTVSCGTSGTDCTLGTATCTEGHANSYGGCSGNSCGDFTVAENVDNACGPDCCNGTTCDWSTAVCGAGYHVTGCVVTNTGGHGSCTYDSASGGTALWHGVVHSTDGTHCVLGSCTCRRDGF
jgi:hypothetical protein